MTDRQTNTGPIATEPTGEELVAIHRALCELRERERDAMTPEGRDRFDEALAVLARAIELRSPSNT